MQSRKSLEPAKLRIVFADNAGIGVSSLAEIDLSVKTYCRSIGVMVSLAWKVFNQRRFTAIVSDP
jgi:hypothetical protein